MSQLKNNIRFISMLVFFPSIIFAQEVQQIKLDECQQWARENHPFFKEKERIASSSSLKQDNIRSLWYPQLNANAQATYQSDALKLSMMVPDFSTPVPTFHEKALESSKDQYKITLDVNQLLYDGGSVKAQKQLNETGAEAEQLQNEAELSKIKEIVNSLYFNALLCSDRIKLFESVRSTFEERKKIVDAGFKNGILQISDIDNITIELLKNQQQIDELKLLYNSLLANLSELTGKNFASNAEIVVPEINVGVSIAFNRPDLNALMVQKNSLEFSKNLTQSQRMPKIYAFAQAGYGKPGLNMVSDAFDNFYIVGISLKWNIWDWNKTSRDKQSIVLQGNMLDSRQNAIERNLRIQLNSSKSNISQYEKAIETDNQIVDLRKAVTARSASKLEKGVITASDYIIDKNAETQALIQLQTHKIQLLQEKVNYSTIQGN